MYLVDASVWVSRLVPTDVHHAPSRSWLQELAERGELAVAPALVLAEVAGAVARRTGLPRLGLRAIALFQRLPTSRLVPVDSELGRLGARLAAEERLRGADAIYVALARRLGIPLITWDREQRDRGSAVVTVLDPREASAT